MHTDRKGFKVKSSQCLGYLMLLLNKNNVVAELQGWQTLYFTRIGYVKLLLSDFKSL